jgi:phage terminase large subunit-like protein
LLEERERRKRLNRLAEYKPYTKQAEFHALGAAIRERLLMAGNQLGKTLGAGFEVAMHLTGKYPLWWVGRTWDRPIVAWVASETMEVSRDAAQRILLGRAEQRGEGAIPGADILEMSAYPNVKDAISIAKVRHVSGGVSTVIFKSYDQGRKRFQGDTIDIFWPDEEPPQDIYTEGLTRTNATGGMVLMTFTPLLGMSQVVKRFLTEPDPSRAVVKMGIADAEHYTPEQRAQIIASYPEHEREARAEGTPVLGSGAVFPVAESSITVEPFDIPASWVRIAGLDFGWEHPTAAAWLAWDRDADVLYVYDAYRQKQQSVVIHGAAIKAKGSWPVSWPHDGLQHDKGSGEQLAEQYRAQGVNMLPERATFEDGTNGVEAGIAEMLSRMQTGRLKVFRHLADWLDEFRTYHRKDGLIVKEADDLMAATRYAVMMKRHAALQTSSVDLSKFRFDFA